MLEAVKNVDYYYTIVADKPGESTSSPSPPSPSERGRARSTSFPTIPKH